VQQQTYPYFVQNELDLPDRSIINAIVFDAAIASASGSLLLWGAINLGTWFFFRADNMAMFTRINAPDGTFDLFLYGGGVIGACMLIFGAVGATTKTVITGWLDGLSLLGVGIWNLLHDILLADAIRPYGYKMEQPGTLWLMLGVSQLVWGGKQLHRFSTMGTKPIGVTSEVKTAASKKLKEMIKLAGDPAAGRLKFSITCRHNFPFFNETTDHYTMWLMKDRALCLEHDMKRVIQFERVSLKSKNFQGSVIPLVDTNGCTWRLAFEKTSLAPFAAWATHGP